jgi:WD40 repeat protein
MIRKLWVLLAFLWLQAGADEARLTIDTGAHTGTIWDVVVMKNGDVITASGDKTIRVWDKKSFQEKRKILGDIGDATVGQIFAIALSPDEKYLAVGGYLHAKKSATYGLIRIYDFQSGTLVKTLDAHNNVINDLAFSPDGKYLLSGSTDASVKFWDMGTFTLISSFEFHKGSVFEVALEQEQNKLVAYSTSYDHSIAKFDPFSKEILATFVADDKLQRLALKNNEIAVCGFEKNIYILDKNLKLKKKFATHVVMKKLAYTPDGAHLLAGSADAPYGVTVYDAAYREKGRFSEHTNTVVAIAPLNSNQIVSCGGDKKGYISLGSSNVKGTKT